MITYIAVAATVAAVAAVYDLVAGILFRARKELSIANVIETQAHMQDVLQVVKAHAESARTNRKEATVARDQTAAAADRVVGTVEQKTDEIKTLVSEMPAAVVAVLKTDSGTHTRPTPEGST